MRTISVLFCITTVWLSVKAIIVSVDRADYKPTHKHSSMFGNGWRPVTGHDEINLKVSPTSKVQRFAAAPLHPVIGKLQEHLGSSDTSKHQNRNRPPDFAPPAILGSFSVFGHATAKTREDPTINIKLLPSETRKYSFLLPPNRDLFHSPDTQYISKTPKPDIRDPAYYSNGPRYSPTASPLVANRPSPVYNTYNVQQTLQPPDRPGAAFEYQNSNNPYLVPPGVDYAKDFGKNKSSQQYYNQNSHPQNFQPSNSDPNNYFNYINHASPYKVTYERNPAYLIHESHEVGYVTPSFEMKFKPSSYQQNYIMPPGVYTSTLPPMKFNYLQLRPSNVNNENHSENNAPQKLKNSQTNNEVYRNVRPQKQKQEYINNTRNYYFPEEEPDFVYMPPETQQYFRQTVTPIEQTTEKEYETPESISLKHYNDQLARLAIQKNRQRFRDHEQKQDELQSQQYNEYNRQQEEEKLFNKSQRPKTEKERTRNSGRNKPPAREEYQEEKLRSPLTPISGQRFPSVDQGKTVELYEVTVSEQPTVSRHSTTTQQPIAYYQTTQTPQQPKYESPQDYWEQNVQYPQEGFSSTKVPEPQRQSPKYPSRGEPQIISLYPDPVTTQISIQTAAIVETVTDIPVYTTNLPERTTDSPTERTRNHRPSGKRRRRPTVAAQEPRNPALKTRKESPERENSSGDMTRKNQAKPQQTKFEKSVGERKPSNRRRPEVGVKTNKNELDVQTETVIPNRFETPREEQLVYVTEFPTYYQNTPTESTESVTENLNFEYVQTNPPRPSSINNYEYVTEPTRSRVSNYDYVTEPTRSRVSNYDYMTEPTRPSRINNYEELQKTDYVETTIPPTSTTPFTTTKEPQRTTTTSTPSTTKPAHRIRPSRVGNTSRPRFSVKEYKSRLDYKNRISQISTTEGSDSPVKQRPTVEPKKKQQSAEVRETTGKYKYMSRVSYRTSSTTPSTEDQANTTFTTYTRNKINKFTPKQRPNNSYLYRSRTTSTTSNSAIKEEGEVPPTIRPENVFSSSIRQRPSVMRGKLRNSKEPSGNKDEIEMVIEETSFYSQPTSQPSQSESLENKVNEILEETQVTPSSNQSKDEEVSKVQESFLVNEKSEAGDESLKVNSELKPINELPTTTSKQSDEELFEKASQSVADLTSSASALYNKPGLFKAVSPSTENRIISTHLKITTGEPTLPIEAFFHNLSEKV